MLHLIVCYDIVEDKRRQKLCKQLKQYLKHVQKSVFEGALPQPLLSKVVGVIKSNMNPETDTVRLYSQCIRCKRETTCFGTAQLVDAQKESVILM